MGDKYQQKSYEEGREDALTGKGNGYKLKFMKTVLNPRTYLPGGKEFSEQSMGYYAKGFDDGMRRIVVESQPKKEVSVFSDNRNFNASIGGDNMSVDLYKQLEFLEELKQKLQDEKKRLTTMKESIFDISDELREAGMIVQRHEHFARHLFHPFVETLDEVVNKITLTYIPKVESEILDVEDQITRLSK